MASARCVYCGATLEPNSMFCLSCGQLAQHPGAYDDDADNATEAWDVSVPTKTKSGVTAGQPLSAPSRTRLDGASESAAIEGDTVMPEHTVASTPAVHEQPQPGTSTWPDAVALEFESGRVVVSGAAVLGRRPEQMAANLGAQAVEIDDATRSISRVHLFLDLADGQLLAADAGSSNGSSVERAGRRLTIPAGGERFAMHPGDVLWVGDARVAVSPA